MTDQTVVWGACNDETVCLSSNAALRLADYVYILVEEEMQFDGAPDPLGGEDELMSTYLGL